uniref:HTH_48 domain-containing protein n=1 Tax=Strongyloides papillosus TaxID=174720 RepID=A0A0N5BH76_STREA
MECQVDKKQHFRHLLLFAFNRGQRVAEAVREICSVYGEDAIGWSTAKDWYRKFRNGNFDLQDSPRTGRPSSFDEERLTDLLREDNRQTCRKLSEKMNCGLGTISRHLTSIGYEQKFGVWLPHHLTEKNKEKRLTIAAQHLARHRATRGHKERFLHRIVTGDEKWCLYVNWNQRKQWVKPGSTPNPRVKPDPHPKKTMICVFWDFQGMIH